MMEKLDIDAFGKIMDELIERHDVKMLISMPAGTQEAEIQDNLGCGGVVQFYILLSAIKPIYQNIVSPLLADEKEEDFVDTILSFVKNDLLEIPKEDEHD